MSQSRQLAATDQGFHISPYHYEGKFEAVGMIFKTIYQGVKNNTGTPEYFSDGRWSAEKIDRQRIVDEICQEAKSMGANAVVNLKFSTSTGKVNTLTVPVVEVEGFAIKII